MFSIVTNILDDYDMRSVVQDNLVMYLFQAEDGIRYLGRSRGLGDVYERQE